MKHTPDNLQSTQRRRLLAAAAASPLVATSAGVLPVHAMQHKSGADSNAIKHTVAVGELEVTTLLVGSRVVEGPQNIFGKNVSAEEFAEASAENFLPTDAARFYFTPTVVKSGSDIVLFDTGLNPAGISSALAVAGIEPADITTVVLTHMHGDHIGGLADDDGKPTFANAAYVTGQVEFDSWAKTDNKNFNAKVKPLAEKMTFIGDGASVAGGITSVAAFGHTPGHMTYMLESNGAQLLIMADTANHYVYSLSYPDWEVKFDMDKAAAAATRKKVFGMLAADKVPMIGYHMPFPGMGYVAARGEGGFQYVPVSYQLSL
jgi:glyoxylase-like metal-dependent hydrolase (beta-lactamase superfamily II)